MSIVQRIDAATTRLQAPAGAAAGIVGGLAAGAFVRRGYRRKRT